MVWLTLIPALYLLLLIGIAWISVHPYRIPQWISPGALGAPQNEVEFVAFDGSLLRGWWVGNPEAKSVMVLAHGYMMNRCELTPEAFFLWQRGMSCLLLDLRAHGRSRGKRCTLGNLERQDIRAAVQFAKSRMPEAKVVLMGSSMGAAACAFALGDDPSLADAIILDSAYGKLSSAILGWWRFLGGTLLAVALSPMPLVAWPIAGFNPFVVDVARSVANFGETPVLLFHGACDTLALPQEARRNIAAIQGPKEVVWFEGCGHSEGRWVQPEKHHEALFGFLERHRLIDPSVSPQRSSA